MTNILRTIEAFPLGRTTSELFGLLEADRHPSKRRAILRDLANLTEQGRIELGKDAKWRPIGRLPTEAQSASAPTRLKDGEAGEFLAAVPASFQRGAPADVAPALDTTDAKPDPTALLRYYRSVLRSDPRGAIEQAPDRHGEQFVLTCGRGEWWPDTDRPAVIRVRLDDLPGKFREALTRREGQENSLAVGWPIATGRRSGAEALWPAGLMSARWWRDEVALVIEIVTDDVMINPNWLREAARQSAWSATDLRRLFAEDVDSGMTLHVFRLKLQEAFASRISERLKPASLAGVIDPASDAVQNAMGLFLPVQDTFTAGAERDMDAIASWEPQAIAATALGALLGSPSPSGSGPPAINVHPVNAEQIDAIRAGMDYPLSVVTGPPGTGKSQAIVGMAASALIAGERVLVASRNHQALDAVETRLGDICPDVPFLVRTLDPATDRDMNIVKVLDALVASPSRSAAPADPKNLAALNEAAKARSGTLGKIDEIRRLNVRLADHIERLEAISRVVDGEESLPEPRAARRRFWITRLFSRLFARPLLQTPGSDEPLDAGASRSALEAAIRSDRERLAGLAEPADPVSLTEKIGETAKRLLPVIIAHRTALDEETRQHLIDVRRDDQLSGRSRPSREVCLTTLDHRPLWLASVLGTPRRLPLEPGLFDLVIFDEASQCDIASALPLFARARRAVVVGDDKQLGGIARLGVVQDRNLMDAQGLPATGMGRYAQSLATLFDLASSVRGAPRTLLRNQYRSAPEIVEYISQTFYSGKLRVALGDELKTPPGRKPGLAWDDVPGRPGLDAGRNVNTAEAERIAAHLREILVEQGYRGSVGVIAPFRNQVAAIMERIEGSVPPPIWQEVDLRIATVDGFQGQERDLILFSPTVCADSAASGITFVQRDWRRLNVAISRARAVAHIFGDLSFARSGKIKSLQTLAARATEPPRRQGEGTFDSGWERIVDAALKRRGLRYQAQYEIAGRRLDFAVFGESVKLDLEVDGRIWHLDQDGRRKIDDHWRDHQLKGMGWKVRRFWVDELNQDLEGCLDTVERDIA